jgi:hypothetical protein
MLSSLLSSGLLQQASRGLASPGLCGIAFSAARRLNNWATLDPENWNGSHPAHAQNLGGFQHVRSLQPHSSCCCSQGTDRVPVAAVYGTTCYAAALSCKDTYMYVALDPLMHVCFLQWLAAGLVLLRAKPSQTQ